jgi:WD40 repeat protein
MSVQSSPLPDDLNPEFNDDQELDDRDMPGIHAPTGLSAIAPRGGFAGMRQSVWERTGLSSLPIFTSSPVRQSAQSAPLVPTGEPPISSHLSEPSSIPLVNYKHLYLTHSIISKRIRHPTEDQRPMIVDAISSIEAGGLSGHTEAIYSLTLFRRPMNFNLKSCSGCSDDTYRLLRDDGRDIGDLEVSGRDWLLTGSRDRTLRLWQLDHPKPRVVKVFMGAHEGSVLSAFVVKIKATAGSTNHSRTDVTQEKLMAITGGSDGKICSWDLEGDGTAEKEVLAHQNSVMCVKGDDERIVSCSKGKSLLSSN